MRSLAALVLALVVMACETQPADPTCAFPTDPVTVLEEDGLVLRTWTFTLDEVHLSAALPRDSDYLAYREAIEAEGADAMHPELALPPARDETEAAIWLDEEFNNELAYTGQVGSIEPIACLDALLFAEQNRRVSQLEQPTEFLASVLRRQGEGGDEVMVIFGAGSEMFPPRSVDGREIVADRTADGWRYWYFLHNHTRQGNGSLGVPVPGTSDVRFVRSLASELGLERVRVTNGFYTFDASIEALSGFRER